MNVLSLAWKARTETEIGTIFGSISTNKGMTMYISAR